ncbi:MAG: helix-turn-helix transcriptional regulator [Oligoflexales bacterium]|nr:helix-turn-helix transcriptional regulator [Oligoflexales bacterium]
MNSISKNISLNIKCLRTTLGWSLDKASDQTGVSKAMLGQIEREESSPTIVTLWKIAKGFKVPFSTFLEKPRKSKIHSKVATSDHWLNSPDGNMLVNPIFPFDPELKFEMFVIQLLPRYEHVSVPHEAGIIEHVVVTSGKMEVFIKEIWELLNAGEGVHFEADQEHGYRNPSSDETLIFHNIIHYPK